MLTLQALFDDSGTKGTGRWMVMSGLFAEAQLIASLADEWDRWLRAKHPGSIRYFKMDEAVGLDGEFKFWDPLKRDEKVRQMAEVINRSDLTEIAAWISLDAYAHVSAGWEHIKGKHALTKPYIMLFHYVMVSAVTEAVERGATGPIEIVYDNHDTFRSQLLSEYDGIRAEETIPARAAVMPVQPWFRDDQEFVMLQAADLLAGEIRLIAEESPKNPAWVGTLCPKLHVSKYRKGIGIRDLLELDAHLRKLAAEGGLN